MNTEKIVIFAGIGYLAYSFLKPKTVQAKETVNTVATDSNWLNSIKTNSQLYNPFLPKWLW